MVFGTTNFRITYYYYDFQGEPSTISKEVVAASKREILNDFGNMVGVREEMGDRLVLIPWHQIEKVEIDPCR